MGKNSEGIAICIKLQFLTMKDGYKQDVMGLQMVK